MRLRHSTLVLACLLGLASCTGSEAPPPASAGVESDPRQQLDDAMRLASELKYDAAIAAFEDIRAKTPAAVSALDGLKFVVIYGVVGDTAKFEALTRSLVERYRQPATATDADRSVKGYIVHRAAKDRDLLAHAVEVTRFASEQAAADGEEAYQGFFDTSHGVALYRVGRFKEAADWLSKHLEHDSLYVRSLALPVSAMTELALGNRVAATNLLKRSRATAGFLPESGSDEYLREWTDTLIARQVLAEAEDVFAAAGVR